MKRLFSVLFLTVTLFVAIPSQAQIKFGVKGGLNITNMSFSKDVVDASNQTGFFIGPSVKFTLPIVGLGVDASALYDQREAKMDDSKTVKEQSINIPINLRYNIGIGSLVGVYFAAGPQFGFNVGDKNFTWTAKSAENTFEMKKSNFSVNLGGGVYLLKHLEIGCTYNIVCGKTGDMTVSDMVYKGRTNAWQISAAYYF